MTYKEKQLLLKDLYARLPYKVIIYCTDSYKFFLTTDTLNVLLLNIEYRDYKPYLRPMSSMTEEEKDEYKSIMFVCGEDFSMVIDWLNEHHFDYRGLIKKGLALEAPEGIYERN